VLPSDGTALSNYELEALTDEIRKAALKVFSCIVDLGKKAQETFNV